MESSTGSVAQKTDYHWAVASEKRQGMLLEFKQPWQKNKLKLYLYRKENSLKTTEKGRYNVPNSTCFKDRGSVDQISLDQNCHFSLDQKF